MTKERAWLYSKGLQKPRRRILKNEYGRLRQPGFGKGVCHAFPTRITLCPQKECSDILVKARCVHETVSQFINSLPENRIVLIQTTPHAGVLSALPRKHKDRFERCVLDPCRFAGRA